jgi:hypothetical protein
MPVFKDTFELFPATQIPEALPLEGKLNLLLVENSVEHLGTVHAGLQAVSTIGTRLDARALANGFSKASIR